MGCFLGCFGSSKDRKRKKQRYKVIPRDQKPKIQNLVKADVSLEQSIEERPSNLVPESRRKTEVPLSLKRRKKVTFDTNVTTYEHIQVYDSTESLLEKNEKGETFPKSAQTLSQSDTDSKDDSVVLRTSNYRYGNCLESDEEVEDLDHDDIDLDEDDDDDLVDGGYDEEEDGASVPSMELRAESSSLNTIGSNRNARDRNGYVLSVLNPVENLTQWNALKSKGTTRKPLNFNGQKDNSSLNFRPPKPKNQNQETAVDASLSNWLIS